MYEDTALFKDHSLVNSLIRVLQTLQEFNYHSGGLSRQRDRDITPNIEITHRSAGPWTNFFFYMETWTKGLNLAYVKATVIFCHILSAMSLFKHVMIFINNATDIQMSSILIHTSHERWNPPLALYRFNESSIFFVVVVDCWQWLYLKGKRKKTVIIFSKKNSVILICVRLLALCSNRIHTVTMQSSKQMM